MRIKIHTSAVSFAVELLPVDLDRISPAIMTLILVSIISAIFRQRTLCTAYMITVGLM